MGRQDVQHRTERWHPQNDLPHRPKPEWVQTPHKWLSSQLCPLSGGLRVTGWLGWREALQPGTQTTCSSSAAKESKTSHRAAPSILLLLGRCWAAACSPGMSSMASTEGPEATPCRDMTPSDSTGSPTHPGTPPHPGPVRETSWSRETRSPEPKVSEANRQEGAGGQGRSVPQVGKSGPGPLGPPPEHLGLYFQQMQLQRHQGSRSAQAPRLSQAQPPEPPEARCASTRQPQAASVNHASKI